MAGNIGGAGPGKLESPPPDEEASACGVRAQPREVRVAVEQCSPQAVA